MTRGALTTFSIATMYRNILHHPRCLRLGFSPTVAQYHGACNPAERHPAAVIFNALIIVALIPCLAGRAVSSVGAARLLRDNLLIYDWCLIIRLWESN